MVRFSFLALVLSACIAVPAQTVELLWPNGAPSDTGGGSKPSVTVFPADPKKAMGTAIIICPGGDYQKVNADKEGYQIAKWLNTLGVAAFVLAYRVAPYRHPIQMGDAMRAMRYVRANSKRFQIDPNRIAIAGFSAGGHLASTVAVHFDDGNPNALDTIDRQGCRPYFQILGYPIITMVGPYAHGGSRLNLLGANPSPENLDYLSNEKHITSFTPAAFLVHANDDPTVYIENSTYYRDSLMAHDVPVQTQFYSHGPHGFGLANGVAGAPNLPEIAGWTTICANWMSNRGFLSPSNALRRLDLAKPEHRYGPLMPDILGRLIQRRTHYYPTLLAPRKQ